MKMPSRSRSRHHTFSFRGPPRRPIPEKDATIAMSVCWRTGCSNAIPKDDDMGLCRACLDLLRNPDYVRPVTDGERRPPRDIRDLEESSG